MAIVNKVEECTWPAHCWLSAVLEAESSFLDHRNEYLGFRKVGVASQEFVRHAIHHLRRAAFQQSVGFVRAPGRVAEQGTRQPVQQCESARTRGLALTDCDHLGTDCEVAQAHYGTGASAG